MKGHKVLEPMFVRYGIAKKEESVPILTKARKLIREQGLPKWDVVEKVVGEMKEKKGRINFFRGDSIDSNYSRSNNFSKEKIMTTFIGQWV